LPGSSLFPSWTRDGRLSFRYDGPEYRGFMLLTSPLSKAAVPLSPAVATAGSSRWEEIFPETSRPSEDVVVVTIWSAWSAHSADALLAAQQARERNATNSDVAYLSTVEPGTRRLDADRLLRKHEIDLVEIPLAPERFVLTDGDNQMPATLLFVRGLLADRRLGAQTYDQLRDWISTFTTPQPSRSAGVARMSSFVPSGLLGELPRRSQ
jgi:hypothetical protein